MGVYIMLRGMSYIGHGLSHAIFGGAIVGWIMSISPLIGGSSWGFLLALLITWTTRKNPIGSDAAIGIITTASFALGIAIISRYKNFINVEALLLGCILGVDPADLIAILVVVLIVTAVFFFVYKLFLFATFDAEVAQFYGVPTE